ncbi:MAG: prepilin-type N-terminal cleavage/methylation domain-containing protein [Planctomycetota bacterium]
MVARRAFSLIELVIVVVILGVIAAIAVPRMGSAAETAKANRLVGDLRTLQEAADRYTAEHWGKNPGVDTAGSPVSAATLVGRLVGTSDEDGTLAGDGIYGPYLRTLPANAVNGKSRVIVGTAIASPSTYGWRFNPQTGSFTASAVGGPTVEVTGSFSGAAQVDTAGGVRNLNELGSIGGG